MCRIDIEKLIPIGKNNRITACEIERITKIAGGGIRAEINALRSKFVPIAADGQGYFIAENPDELDHTIASLNSRIHKMIQAREGLKKAQELMKTKKN